MTAINEKLSPVAEAIEDAAYAAWVIKDDSRSIAISTLRALADQAGSMKHWHIDQIPSIAAELEAPTLLECAINGDSNAAKKFLHEAGFTDKQGQWLPQYQPIPETTND